MIAIKGAALAAVAGVAAIAFAPRAAADETFTLEFRHDATRPALDNYLAFLRQAQRACAVPDPRALGLRGAEQACVEDVMNRLVAAMGRQDIAALHIQRTGPRDDSSRALAAR